MVGSWKIEGGFRKDGRGSREMVEMEGYVESVGGVGGVLEDG